MATLAARLANNGTYYVAGSLDDATFNQNGSYTPISGPYNYFNLSNDPLAGYESGSYPWTVEFWYYTGPRGGGSPVSTYNFLQAGNGGGTGTGYTFYISNNGANSIITFQLSSPFAYPGWATTIFTDSWYHFALVRSSGTSWTLYVNGVSLGTVTTGATFTWSTPLNTFWAMYALPLGSKVAAFKVTTGAALYTSNFNTSLLPGYFFNTVQISPSGTTTLLIAPSINNLATNLGTSGTSTLSSGNTWLLTTSSPIQTLDIPYIPGKLYSNGVHQVSGYFDEVSMTNSYNTSISLHYSNNSFTGAAYGNTHFPYIQVTGDPFAGYGTAGNIWTYEQWIYFDNALTTLYGGNLAFGNFVTNGWELQFTLSPTGTLSNSVNFIAGTSTSYFPRGALMNLNAGWNHIAVQKGTYAYSLDYYVNGVHTNANNAAVSVGATWNYSSSSNFNFYPLENSTSNYQDTFLGPIRIVGGYNVYPLSNFTPDYFSSIQPISTGGAVTTFLFAPNINDSNIYINKGNAVSNVPVISAYNPQFTKSSYIYSKSYSNTVISSNNLPVAKIYSNGVFAITNTAVFDEVSYPTGSINVQSYNFISTPVTWQTDSRFVPGSNNFTIEFWINPRTTSTGTAANSSIMGLYNHSSTGYPSSGGNVCWGLGFATNSSTLLFFYNINGGTGVGVFDSIPSTSQLPLSTWTHVAITRNNKLISMYLNGILNNSFNDTTLTTIQNPSSLIFGIGDNNGDFFNGFLSNVRITMNQVLYTSNFSPPTFQLTSSANTSLLLKTPHNSASSKDFSYNNFGFVFPFSSSNTVPFSL
jgi:Concanavalin A-like lectin/glucanases superfamily